MNGSIRLLFVVAVAAAGPAGRAVAGPADDPAASLKKEWTDATDERRRALLDGVGLVADPAALEAVTAAAKSSCELTQEAKRLRKQIATAIDEAKEKEGKPPDLTAADKKMLADLERSSERETKALGDLVLAAGRVLDALPDPDFERGAGGLLRDGPADYRPGFADWAAAAVGAAKKERTVAFCVTVAAEALVEFKKNLALRAAPAKKLETLNAKIADLLESYLKKQQEKGDYSGQVPVTLLGNLPEQRAALEREVRKFQEPMDLADLRRRAARTALGKSIAAQDDAAVRERLLDLVEKRLIGDADPDVKAFGIGALGPVPGDRSLGLLAAAAVLPDPRFVVTALDALGERGDERAIDLLAKALADSRWQVRAAAAAGLARTGRSAAVPPLVDALGSAVGRTLDDLKEALANLTGKSYPAASSPWKAWWEKEGATFRGPRDPAPDGKPVAAPPADATASAPEEGGTTFYGITTHSTRVLFVLDFSGSMMFPGSESDTAKKKIDVLKAEMRRAVAGLPDGATFGIVGFSADVRVWKKDAVSRNAKTAADAVEWVEKQPVIGATNVHDALETAFRMAAPKDRPEPVFDTMFFMTDGRPTAGKLTDPKQIRAEVRRWNEAKRVRVHVVGMGGHQKQQPGSTQPPADDLDEDFLKGLAADNSGLCVIH